MHLKRKYREETLQEYKTYKTWKKNIQKKNFTVISKEAFHYLSLLRYDDSIYHRKILL